MRKRVSGFTIVELLIVIVVIAILATISVVAYNGVQARARDAQRQQDVKTIVKALEMYYIDNGKYPPGACTANCAKNAFWSTTNDGSWDNLAVALVPKYISSLPSDPKPSPGADPTATGAYGYGYYANTGTYCGTNLYQMYILVYALESSTQQQVGKGACTSNPVSYSNGHSYYRVAIGGS